MQCPGPGPRSLMLGPGQLTVVLFQEETRPAWGGLGHEGLALQSRDLVVAFPLNSAAPRCPPAALPAPSLQVHCHMCPGPGHLLPPATSACQSPPGPRAHSGLGRDRRLHPSSQGVCCLVGSCPRDASRWGHREGKGLTARPSASHPERGPHEPPRALGSCTLKLRPGSAL